MVIVFIYLSKGYFFESMISPHPNNDIKTVNINTITLFHAFLQFLKFG